jgi:hypothetical protein
MKKYIVSSIILLSIFSISTVASASNNPSLLNIRRSKSGSDFNANIVKLNSLISGGNIKGTITAINGNSYTISVTNKDGTITTENVSFDSKTKESVVKPMDIKPSNAVTKPKTPNPHNIHVFSTDTTTATTTPTLQIGDPVRIKVRINSDGSLYALAIHLTPIKNKKN